MTYHSDRGLLPFQAEGVAVAYVRRRLFLLWSTGIGKSVGAIALADLLIEDGAVDVVLIVCERNKVKEWVEDFTQFTDRRTKHYSGKTRAGFPENVDDDTFDVIVSTYETFKNDIGTSKGKRAFRVTGHGRLSRLVGKRVLVVYDEISSKFRSRTSATYKAHDHFIRVLTKAQPEGTWVIGLTATPVERDAESYFNMMRIVSPDRAPLVGEFERDYVHQRDNFGRVATHANITADDPYRYTDVQPLVERFAPAVHIKSKDDPDVRDLFPEPVEEWEHVDLHPRQREFYDALASITDDDPDGVDVRVMTLLRQAAILPQAILSSETELASEVIAAVGRGYIEDLPSAKVERLITRLRQITEQGDRAVVFTFYGPSVIPRLSSRLSDEGLLPTSYYGGMSQTAREASRARFRGGQANVLLSSDAGSRGINIPEASYVLNLDPPTLHSTYIQRINRVHRLGSAHAFVHALTLIASDTVEEGLIRTWLRRNEWSDQLVGPENLTREERERALSLSSRG